MWIPTGQHRTIPNINQYLSKDHHSTIQCSTNLADSASFQSRDKRTTSMFLLEILPDFSSNAHCQLPCPLCLLWDHGSVLAGILVL